MFRNWKLWILVFVLIVCLLTEVEPSHNRRRSRRRRVNTATRQQSRPQNAKDTNNNNNQQASTNITPSNLKVISDLIETLNTHLRLGRRSDMAVFVINGRPRVAKGRSQIQAYSRSYRRLSSTNVRRLVRVLENRIKRMNVVKNVTPPQDIVRPSRASLTMGGDIGQNFDTATVTDNVNSAANIPNTNDLPTAPAINGEQSASNNMASINNNVPNTQNTGFTPMKSELSSSATAAFVPLSRQPNFGSTGEQGAPLPTVSNFQSWQSINQPRQNNQQSQTRASNINMQDGVAETPSPTFSARGAWSGQTRLSSMRNNFNNGLIRPTGSQGNSFIDNNGSGSRNQNSGNGFINRQGRRQFNNFNDIRRNRNPRIGQGINIQRNGQRSGNLRIRQVSGNPLIAQGNTNFNSQNSNNARRNNFNNAQNNFQRNRVPNSSQRSRFNTFRNSGTVMQNSNIRNFNPVSSNSNFNSNRRNLNINTFQQNRGTALVGSANSMSSFRNSFTPVVARSNHRQETRTPTPQPNQFVNWEQNKAHSHGAQQISPRQRRPILNMNSRGRTLSQRQQSTLATISSGGVSVGQNRQQRPPSSENQNMPTINDVGRKDNVVTRQTVISEGNRLSALTTEAVTGANNFTNMKINLPENLDKNLTSDPKLAEALNTLEGFLSTQDNIVSVINQTVDNAKTNPETSSSPPIVQLTTTPSSNIADLVQSLAQIQISDAVSPKNLKLIEEIKQTIASANSGTVSESDRLLINEIEVMLKSFLPASKPLYTTASTPVDVVSTAQLDTSIMNDPVVNINPVKKPVVNEPIQQQSIAEVDLLLLQEINKLLESPSKAQTAAQTEPENTNGNLNVAPVQQPAPNQSPIAQSDLDLLKELNSLLSSSPQPVQQAVLPDQNNRLLQTANLAANKEIMTLPSITNQATALGAGINQIQQLNMRRQMSMNPMARMGMNPFMMRAMMFAGDSTDPPDPTPTPRPKVTTTFGPVKTTTVLTIPPTTATSTTTELPITEPTTEAIIITTTKQKPEVNKTPVVKIPIKSLVNKINDMNKKYHKQEIKAPSEETNHKPTVEMTKLISPDSSKSVENKQNEMLSKIQESVRQALKNAGIVKNIEFVVKQKDQPDEGMPTETTKQDKSMVPSVPPIKFRSPVKHTIGEQTRTDNTTSPIMIKDHLNKDAFVISSGRDTVNTGALEIMPSSKPRQMNRRHTKENRRQMPHGVISKGNSPSDDQISLGTASISSMNSVNEKQQNNVNNMMSSLNEPSQKQKDIQIMTFKHRPVVVSGHNQLPLTEKKLPVKLSMAGRHSVNNNRQLLGGKILERNVIKDIVKAVNSSATNKTFNSLNDHGIKISSNMYSMEVNPTLTGNRNSPILNVISPPTKFDNRQNNQQQPETESKKAFVSDHLQQQYNFQMATGNIKQPSIVSKEVQNTAVINRELARTEEKSQVLTNVLHNEKFKQQTSIEGLHGQLLESKVIKNNLNKNKGSISNVNTTLRARSAFQQEVEAFEKQLSLAEAAGRKHFYHVTTSASVKSFRPIYSILPSTTMKPSAQFLIKNHAKNSLLFTTKPPPLPHEKTPCEQKNKKFHCVGKDMFRGIEAISPWCVSKCLNTGCVNSVCHCNVTCTGEYNVDINEIIGNAIISAISGTTTANGKAETALKALLVSLKNSNKEITVKIGETITSPYQQTTPSYQLPSSTSVTNKPHVDTISTQNSSINDVNALLASIETLIDAKIKGINPTTTQPPTVSTTYVPRDAEGEIIEMEDRLTTATSPTTTAKITTPVTYEPSKSAGKKATQFMETVAKQGIQNDPRFKDVNGDRFSGDRRSPIGRHMTTEMPWRRRHNDGFPERRPNGWSRKQREPGFRERNWKRHWHEPPTTAPSKWPRGWRREIPSPPPTSESRFRERPPEERHWEPTSPPRDWRRWERQRGTAPPPTWSRHEGRFRTRRHEPHPEEHGRGHSRRWEPRYRKRRQDHYRDPGYWGGPRSRNQGANGGEEGRGGEGAEPAD